MKGIDLQETYCKIIVENRAGHVGTVDWAVKGDVFPKESNSYTSS